MAIFKLLLIGRRKKTLLTTWHLRDDKALLQLPLRPMSEWHTHIRIFKQTTADACTLFLFAFDKSPAPAKTFGMSYLTNFATNYTAFTTRLYYAGAFHSILRHLAIYAITGRYMSLHPGSMHFPLMTFTKTKTKKKIICSDMTGHLSEQILLLQRTSPLQILLSSTARLTTSTEQSLRSKSHNISRCLRKILSEPHQHCIAWVVAS